MKREQTKVAYNAFLGELEPLDKVTLTIKYYEPNNRRDVDNVQFSAKFILDGLVKAGIIPNDNRKHIDQVIQYVYTDKNDPRIEIYLTEVI